MNPIYDKLTKLDFAIVGVYLVVLLVIGYIASVKQNKATAFAAELDEIQTFALRMQMMSALDDSLSDIVWDGEIS